MIDRAAIKARQVADRDRLTRMALLGGVDEIAMDPRLGDVPGAIRTRAVVTAAIGYLIAVGAINVQPAGDLDEWLPVGIPAHLAPDLDKMAADNRALRGALFPDGVPLYRRPAP